MKSKAVCLDRCPFHVHIADFGNLYVDEPDMQNTAGEAGTSSYVMFSYGPPHMAEQKQDDLLEHTYSSSVRMQDVALKTCQRRWMLGRSGEMMMMTCVFIKPLLPAGYDTKSMFKQSKAGSNWEFSFSWTSCSTKAKEHSLPNYLTIAKRKKRDSYLFEGHQNEIKLVWIQLSFSLTF